MISVVIPVGPFKGNKDWLKECIDSVAQQTMKPVDICLVDDGAQLHELDWLVPGYQGRGTPYSCYLYEDMNIYAEVYPLPWRTGISHAFNYGVMYTYAECVFMLGSDDTLEPTCLERCWEAYLKRDQADGYYSVPIRYMDTGEVQTAPCNAAMVTKGFWRKTGGFPIETAIGIGDSTLLSICLAHKLPVHQVGYDLNDEQTPLYNYRRHPDIHTFKLGPYWGVIDQLRGILTEQWKEPEWGNNYG